MDSFERIVNFEPAFDKRHDDPKKNYGIHGVELRMILKGSAGAVQFILHTNWMMPHVWKEWDEDPRKKFGDHFLCRPFPADVGYHSPKPMYKGDEPIGTYETKIRINPEKVGLDSFITSRIKNPAPRPCEYLGGKPCYCGGSYLAADEAYKLLVTGGSDAVWKYL